MARGLEVELKGLDDLKELLKTKLNFCLSKNCEHNLIHDKSNTSFQCSKKHISIIDGKCEHFKIRN